MGWAERSREGSHHNRSRIPLLNRPGAVCVVSSDRSSVYPQFAAAVANLQTPPGSTMLWQLAGGSGLALARNAIVQQAVAMGAGWTWLIDDDHPFAPDILTRLLKHEKDLVAPLVLKRRPPHEAVARQLYPVSAGATDAELVAQFRAHRDDPPIRPKGGLIEIGHTGTGGLLVSSEVLARMPRPWFSWDLMSEGAGEDTLFCLRARAAGFQIFCDVDTPMGHWAPCAIWPNLDTATGTITPSFHFDGAASPADVDASQYRPFWAARSRSDAKTAS
jgi:hypothetical protein